jgi:hypothetical protein
MHIGGRNIENLHINMMLKEPFFLKDINLKKNKNCIFLFWNELNKL